MALLVAVFLAFGSTNASGGPPPAFVKSDGATRKMAMGSYCWANKCVDFAGMPGGPRIKADPGDIVTFRFGFDPRSVRLYTGRKPARGVRLLPDREVTYEATGRERYLSLFVRAEGHGDVSYGARTR